ncbi:MAG: DMT family transporter [Calditrichaceae bacterium]|nr:DMT family transporter [Calditrichaceae bacterium]MBN2708556.1 DMT family transporter [Calditrichaceae bacterium]RQV96866.1 MAG: DMT family transporter [Calditrichota bacterium]
MIGELAALATALLWSWTALFFTSAGRLVGSFPVNQNRLLFGAVLLFLTHFILIGDYAVTDRGLYSLMASGIIGLVAGDLALLKAFIILGAQRSMLIMALAPAFTSILAYFFLGEVIEEIAIVGIIITLAGIYWVLSEPREKQAEIHGSMGKGIFLALLGAIFQAVGLVIAKYGLNDQMLDPLFATLIRMSAALFASLILMLARHQTREVLRSFQHKIALKYIMLGSIVGPFLGVWFSMISIKHTQTGIGATIMSTTPILIIPFSIIFHKEKPSWRSITGTLITVLGVAILFWK